MPLDSRYRLLVRHFFRRFFENDLISPAGDATVGLSHVVSALITPGLLVVILVLLKYSLVETTWARVVELSFDDALLYVSLSMIILGMAATVTWDAFFLEARDYYIVGVLPVGHRMVAAAKLGALAKFLAIFVGAANAVPMLLVPAFMLQAVRSDTAGAAHLLALMLAHSASALLAGAWAVLAVVTLRGLVALVLPARVFRRVGPFIQGGLVLGLLAWFVLLPQFIGAGRAIFDAGGAGRTASPPMWFLGLYQSIIGQPQPAFHALAWTALAATAAAVLAVMALVLAVPMRRQADVQASAVVLSNRRSPAGRLIGRVVARLLHHPVRRATFAFTMAGLGRSAAHRIYLCAAAGAGLAWSASGFVYVYGRAGRTGLSEPDAATLLMQPILVLFVVAAIRYGATVPISLPASWLFRVTESWPAHRYLSGARAAALTSGVVPVAALVPLHAALWTWDVAAYHAAIGVLYAVFVVELFFGAQTKVPFTAPYVSGNIRLKTRWSLYLLGAWALTGIPAFFESRALRYGRFGVLLPAFLALGAVGLAVLRRRREDALQRLVFDDSADDAPQRLGLLD